MVELSVKVLVNVAEAFSPLKRNVSVRQLFVLLDVTCIQNNDKRVMSVGLCTKDTTSTLKKASSDTTLTGCVDLKCVFVKVTNHLGIGFSLLVSVVVSRAT
jgi:hypothetical protein